MSRADVRGGQANNCRSKVQLSGGCVVEIETVQSDRRVARPGGDEIGNDRREAVFLKDVARDILSRVIAVAAVFGLPVAVVERDVVNRWDTSIRVDRDWPISCAIAFVVERDGAGG